MRRFAIAVGSLACITACESAASKATPRSDDLDLGAGIGKVSAENILREPGWHVWGASAVRGEDGRYHMFYARWPEGMVGRDLTDPADKRFAGMSGWLKYSEIAYAISDKPLGPYQYRSTILKGSGREGDWDQFTAHNPHIKKFGGRYYLYYIGNHRVPDKDLWYSHIGGQCIGVLVADSIDDFVKGNFERSVEPLIRPDGSRTFHRTVNPSVTQGPDGRYYMMFKSYSKKSGRGGNMTHWIAVAPNPTGPFRIEGSVFTAAAFAAEDPYLWFDPERQRFYAVVKNFKRNGALAKQHGALALITSVDGIHDWEPAHHRLVSNRRYADSSGKEYTLAHMERPQLLFGDQGQLLGIFVAASYGNPRKGAATFNVHLPID